MSYENTVENGKYIVMKIYITTGMSIMFNEMTMYFSKRVGFKRVQSISAWNHYQHFLEP